MHQATGELLEELNLGGGFGIAYLAEDDPVSPEDVAGRLRSVIAAECAALGLPVPRLAVEPGRAIAGPGTVTLYVNDFNTAAIATYRRIGMTDAGAFTTILL